MQNSIEIIFLIFRGKNACVPKKIYLGDKTSFEGVSKKVWVF